jgi:hypothetical protein
MATARWMPLSRVAPLAAIALRMGAPMTTLTLQSQCGQALVAVG